MGIGRNYVYFQSTRKAWVSANRILLNDHSSLKFRVQSCRPGNRGVKRSLAAAAIAAAALIASTSAAAEPAAESPAKREPPVCQNVRFSDVGWTDVTATTALVGQLLHSIGYKPSITVLSVPVTFASLKNKDIDVFLGNWMPAQEADRKPYDADGSV